MANEILKFCETDTGTNLLTQLEYLGDSQRPIGNQPGIARDKFVNKVLRQTSFISKVFCDYLIQQTGGDVLDDSNDAALLAKITSTFATGVPVGAIIDLPFPQTPTGYLKTNGAAISRTTYPALFDLLVTSQGFTLQTFTVTIASPAVVTKTAHGFVGGERLRLSTTGTLPTGLNTSDDYFVFVIDANTFRLQTFSNILAGTFVNTSGSQTGTHSFLQSLWGLGDGSTTFNVPDFRGVMRRAWDDGRGINPSAAIASFQMDAIQGHGHQSTIAFWDATFSSSGGAVYGNTINTYRTVTVGDPIATTYGTPRLSSDTRPKTYQIVPVIKF